MENITKIPPEIKERFDQLPKAVQNIILYSDWENTIRSIVDKYKLRIDQGAYLETETMLIMFGFVNPNDFIPDIVKDVNISPEIAQQIEAEVGEKIFKLIRNAIIDITEVKQDEDNPTTQSNESNFSNAPAAITSEDSIMKSRLNTETVERPKSIDPYLEPIE